MKRLKTFTDERGSLTVAETGKDLPFEVKRAYWIYGVPEGHERGKHANRITYQYLVAVKGCVTIALEDKDVCARRTGQGASHPAAHVERVAAFLRRRRVVGLVFPTLPA